MPGGHRLAIWCSTRLFEEGSRWSAIEINGGMHDARQSWLFILWASSMTMPERQMPLALAIVTCPFRQSRSCQDHVLVTPPRVTQHGGPSQSHWCPGIPDCRHVASSRTATRVTCPKAFIDCNSRDSSCWGTGCTGSPVDPIDGWGNCHWMFDPNQLK